jgi:hypothetical protein
MKKIKNEDEKNQKENQKEEIKVEKNITELKLTSSKDQKYKEKITKYLKIITINFNNNNNNNIKKYNSEEEEIKNEIYEVFNLIKNIFENIFKNFKEEKFRIFQNNNKKILKILSNIDIIDYFKFLGFKNINF